MSDLGRTLGRWGATLLRAAAVAAVAGTAAPGCVCTGTPEHGRPFPQLDFGTFPMRQDGNSNPVAWAWKSEGYDDVEVWGLFNLPPPNGFRRLTSQSSQSYTTLRFEWYGTNRHYGTDKPRKPEDVDEFENWIVGDWPHVDDADQVSMRRFDQAAPNGDAMGLVGPGFYRVKQDAKPYVAWIWKPTGAFYETWALRIDDEGDGAYYVPPGSDNPDSTLRIEYYGPPPVDLDEFLDWIAGDEGGNPTPAHLIEHHTNYVWNAE